MDEQQLDFLYEPRLKVMPSMPVVLGAPGFWSRNPDTGQARSIPTPVDQDQLPGLAAAVA
jgi:hypothetical protein